MTPIVNRCPCGKTYTLEQWRKLPNPRVMDLGDGALELRPCVCGSHRAIKIEKQQETAR